MSWLDPNSDPLADMRAAARPRRQAERVLLLPEWLAERVTIAELETFIARWRLDGAVIVPAPR